MFYLQVVNCKVGIMKSQKDSGGLFALVVMENDRATNEAIKHLNQTTYNGQMISVFKMTNRYAFSVGSDRFN